MFSRSSDRERKNQLSQSPAHRAEPGPNELRAVDIEVVTPVLVPSEYRLEGSTPFTEKSAIAVDGCTVGSAVVRCASVRGDVHRRRGGREDDYSLGMTRDGRHMVFAVADGVSSAVSSSAGSRIASRVAAEWLVEQCADLAGALQAAIDEIRRVAKQEGRDEADFATTLAVGTITTRPPVRVSALALGDATLATISAVGGWLADRPDKTLSPDVVPLHPVARARSYSTIVDPGSVFLLATDGLGDGLPSKAVRDVLARRLLPVPPPALNFAALVHMDCGYLFDDRTLLGVWYRSDSRAGDV